MATRENDATSRVIELELTLLDRAVRADPAQLDMLLHLDYVEFGASGRALDRLDVIDELPTEDPDAPRIRATNVTATALADGVMLVTYRSHHTDSPSKTANRSSIWVKNSDGEWRVRFHQGTRCQEPFGA